MVIRASIAQVGAEVWEKDTKLHQRRHLCLDPDTIALLMAYRQARQRRAASVGATLSPEAFVFSPAADGGSCCKPASLTTRYRRLVRALGVRTTQHKLRHYSATELLASGVDLRTVAGRLGHSEGGTTLAFYAAWVREAEQRASALLAARLPRPGTPLAIGPDHARPPTLYQVIAAELRTAIRTGSLLPGTPLPTVKQLAVAHHVAPGTAPSRRRPARPRAPDHSHPRPARHRHHPPARRMPDPPMAPDRRRVRFVPDVTMAVLIGVRQPTRAVAADRGITEPTDGIAARPG